MIASVRQLWSPVEASPAYHKIESQSREGILDCLEEQRRLERRVRILRRWLFSMGVLLSLTLLALGANLALQHKVSTPRSSVVPPLPSKMVVFQTDELFSGPADSATDRAWNHLMPPGQGFVLVEQPDSYGLQSGLSPGPDVTGQMYDIAAFHQIHCLTSIREYLWHFKFAVDMNRTEQIRPILLDPQEDHILDCFDYLRQSIMCSADTTLEWPGRDLDGRTSTVDGWGVTHQCVDWFQDALVNYAEQHAFG